MSTWQFFEFPQYSTSWLYKSRFPYGISLKCVFASKSLLRAYFIKNLLALI